MNSISFAATISEPGYSEIDDVFEPHVSDMGASRALQVMRHARTLTDIKELAGKKVGPARALGETNVGRAQVATRNSWESSIRLVEAVATGVARTLTAKSPGCIVEVQHELLDAYLDYLFSLRSFLPLSAADARS